MGDEYIFASVGIRIIGSHSINTPGFSSSRSGKFCTYSRAEAKFHDGVYISGLNVLHVRLQSFKIEGSRSNATGEWQILELEFDAPQKAGKIESLLENISVGLTMSLADHDFNGYYGNLLAEIDMSSLMMKESLTGVQNPYTVTCTSAIKMEQNGTVTEDLLKVLDTSELASIFVDGMRSNLPKLKYLNWFLPIEKLEQLAKNDLKHLFTPLFSKTLREKIAKESGLGGDELNRLRSLLGNPDITVENRENKLYKILVELNLASFSVNGGEEQIVDLAMCEKLIKARNNLAHAENIVEDNLLHKVLFPLSIRVVKYFTKAEATAGTETKSIIQHSRK